MGIEHVLFALTCLLVCLSIQLSSKLLSINHRKDINLLIIKILLGNYYLYLLLIAETVTHVLISKACCIVTKRFIVLNYQIQLVRICTICFSSN